MTSREIAGDDTGVSAHGLFHPEPSWPAQLALNRPSTYSTCWRPRLGCKAIVVALAAGAVSPRRSGSDRSILLEGKPPTGEPDAGDPPVRFGGRGDRDHSVPPPLYYTDCRTCGAIYVAA
jgi:hypothetical protein